MLPIKEFNICVLGSTGVGKTSICQRLTGISFVRKSAFKSSLEDEAIKYQIEIDSSNGLILFNFYDWAWEIKRKDENINQQLMKGNDGALFVYDITDRRSKSEFDQQLDWYQRASGFDKPLVIISNKNDQKKKSIQDSEGIALSKLGAKRAYVAINLVDDIGLDDMMLVLSKIMMNDMNLSLKGSFKSASQSSIDWSNEKLAAKLSNIGLPTQKQKKVLLVCLNSSVVSKFDEALELSEYVLEAIGSIPMCEEEIIQNSAAMTTDLPIVALIGPPTMSTSQQSILNELALKYNKKSLITVPRNVLDGLTQLLQVSSV